MEQPLLVASEALPGLTIVAPANADRFAVGVYRLTLGAGPSADRTTACVGVAAAGD